MTLMFCTVAQVCKMEYDQALK